MKLTDEQKSSFILDQEFFEENLLQDYVKPVFRGFGDYIRTKRASEKKSDFRKLYKSRFEIFDLTLGVYEIVDINKTISDLVKIFNGSRIYKYGTRIITIINLRFNGNSFLDILLGFFPYWCFKI